MGDKVKVAKGQPFNQLVKLVTAFGKRGLWGGGISVQIVETYTLLIDLGEHDTERVRVFKSVRRACAELILSAGGIPPYLWANREEEDRSWMVDALVKRDLPPEGCWTGDYDELCFIMSHTNPQTGEWSECRSQYCHCAPIP